MAPSNKGKEKVTSEDDNELGNGVNNNNNNNNNEGTTMSITRPRPGPFPPGYRFLPTDEQLIVFYLIPKLNNSKLPPNIMHDIDLYNSPDGPEQLTAKYEAQGDGKWYFFTPRYRKYHNGKRPSRSAGGGTWKATAERKPIKSSKNNNDIIGGKASFKFFKGLVKNNKGTNWIMSEYYLHQPSDDDKVIAKAKTLSIRDDGRNELDKWVLCKIHYHANKKENKSVSTNTKESKQKEKQAKCVQETSTAMQEDVRRRSDNCDSNLERNSQDANQASSSVTPYNCNAANKPCMSMMAVPERTYFPSERQYDIASSSMGYRDIRDIPSSSTNPMPFSSMVWQDLTDIPSSPTNPVAFSSMGCQDWTDIPSSSTNPMPFSSMGCLDWTDIPPSSRSGMPFSEMGWQDRSEIFSSSTGDLSFSLMGSHDMFDVFPPSIGSPNMSGYCPLPMGSQDGIGIPNSWMDSQYAFGNNMPSLSLMDSQDPKGAGAPSSSINEIPSSSIAFRNTTGIPSSSSMGSQYSPVIHSSPMSEKPTSIYLQDQGGVPSSTIRENPTSSMGFQNMIGISSMGSQHMTGVRSSPISDMPPSISLQDQRGVPPSTIKDSPTSSTGFQNTSRMPSPSSMDPQNMTGIPTSSMNDKPRSSMGCQQNRGDVPSSSINDMPGSSKMGLQTTSCIPSSTITSQDVPVRVPSFAESLSAALLLHKKGDFQLY